MNPTERAQLNAVVAEQRAEIARLRATVARLQCNELVGAWPAPHVPAGVPVKHRIECRQGRATA